MPDISMCRGLECPIKKSCYRYTAKADKYRQSYIMNPPYREENNEVICDLFCNNEKETTNSRRPT